jgi:hypothetical protein
MRTKGFPAHYLSPSEIALCFQDIVMHFRLHLHQLQLGRIKSLHNNIVTQYVTHECVRERAVERERARGREREREREIEGEKF